MKLRYAIIFILALAAITLNACTLASDVTPPPDYVAPTPMPTLGPLFPASAPSIENGAQIYAAKCAACHGDTGLGDGPDGKQLSVRVPALGLAESAQSASPAQWFKVVSQGNIERFMPPFISLTDQQRWDVVSYAMSLHITPDQIARGKSLFEANCPDCQGKFTNQEKMASLSEADLFRIIKKGNADVAAFGANFTDEETWAVAAYLRTLTFAPPAAPTPAAVSTETPAAGSETTEAATATSSVLTAQGTPVSSTGSINGIVQIASGSLPANLTITLRGFDHAQDQTTGPQEVLTLTGTAAADGTFVFENVALPVNRIYVAEVSYAGVQYQSGLTAVKSGDTKISLPAIKLYEATQDFSLLSVEQVHLYSDFSTQGTVQFFEIYSFSNNSDKAVIISTDGSTVPFIKLPDGAQSPGYQAGQNSAPFVSAGKGIAVVPSDTPYSIIGFFSLPYDKKVEVNQPFAIDAVSVLLLVPEGMKVNSTQLTNLGVQTIQNNNFLELSAKSIKAGDTLTFTVSGSPKTGANAVTNAAAPNTQQGLLIGAGALGLALIVAGTWLYLRSRKRGKDDDEEEEFASVDDVMDAMLALDDLRRAGKISEEVYQTRRDELKEILKELA